MADESAPPVTPSLEQSTAPKARTRAGAWIGVISTVLAGTALIAVADKVPQPDSPRSAAEELLPADGDAALVTYDDGSTWVIESGFSIGQSSLLDLPPGPFVHQNDSLQRAGLSPDQQRYWRQTWTDASGDRGQLTELYHLTESGVAIATVTGGELGFSYDPGLLILPSDIHDGSTWSGQGDALPNDLLRYSSTGSAVTGDDGCLDVTIDVRYTAPLSDDEIVRQTSETATWCPTVGPVGATFVVDGVSGSTRMEPLVAQTLDGSTTSSPADYSAAEQWSGYERLLVAHDPLFGGVALFGASGTPGPQTESGVQVFTKGSDVVGYARDERGRIARQWFAHPGGTVIGVTVFGDAIIVATSNRQLVAYDSSGARVWTSTFSDVVDAPPVADGLGSIIALSLDGELRRLSVEDGTEMWNVDLGSDSAISPAVSGRTVIALDRDESVRAFDLETGTSLWDRSFPDGRSVVASGEKVFLVTAWGAVSRMDPATGDVLWTVDGTASTQNAIAVDDGLVLLTSQEAVRLSGSGDEIWRRPAHDQALTDGTSVVLLSSDSLEVIDHVGSPVVRFTLPPRLISSRTIISGMDRIWIATSDYGLTEVGP